MKPKNCKDRKKIVLLFFPLLIFFFALAIAQRVDADTSESMRGWLWDGFEEVKPDLSKVNTGVSWISMNNVDASGDAVNGNVDYGVNVPATDGDLSGYAWNANIGWISFNQADLVGCPDGGCFSKRIGDKLIGWARIISIKEADAIGNSGGWKGFVKLYGTDGTGITINSDNTLSGYGWNGENVGGINDGLGWIDFSRAFLVPPPECSLPQTLGGGKISVGESVEACQRALVDCESDCDCEMRQCLPDGTLSGSYENLTCAVSMCSCNPSYDEQEKCRLTPDDSFCLMGNFENSKVLSDGWEWQCVSSSDPNKTVSCRTDKKCDSNWIEIVP